MTDRPHLVPGPEHPITVTEAADLHVTVRGGGMLIADSTRALALQEADYPVAYYLPSTDVDFSILESSGTQTHCPFKGDASYWSVVGADGRIDDAVWGYPEPYPAVAGIVDHVAFYPGQVEITVEPAPAPTQTGA